MTADPKLVLVDENEMSALEVRDFTEIPAQSRLVSAADNEVRSITHCLTDVFKGAISVPNKTIEVVFDKKIQDGLNKGTLKLLTPKTGEGVYADAVKQSGRLAGKGRLVESGHLRRFAASSYQFLSIAVAQSHLADIDASLRGIRQELKDINQHLDLQEEAEIEGDAAYLSGVLEDIQRMKPNETISQQKKDSIEEVIRHFHTAYKLLTKKFEAKIEGIRKVEDTDFGLFSKKFTSGQAYDKVTDFVNDVNAYVQRWKQLLTLVSMIDLTKSYTDPTGYDFSSIRIEVSIEELEALMQRYADAVTERAKRLGGNFEDKERIELRQYRLSSLIDQQRRDLLETNRHYLAFRSRLHGTLESLTDSQDKVRLAVSFDAAGEIARAAILSDKPPIESRP